MMHQELLRSLFLVLVVGSMTVNMQNTKELSNRVPLKRTTPKPGFIKTVFQAAYEQWTDTRDTLNKINKMLNDNFIPESAVSSTTAASSGSSDTNATTTRAPYRITRNEFSRILRRNVNGLVRLFNLELADALKKLSLTSRSSTTCLECNNLIKYDFRNLKLPTENSEKMQRESFPSFFDVSFQNCGPVIVSSKNKEEEQKLLLNCIYSINS